MPSLNRAIIIGHLGKDPETRQTTSGKAVCNFTVATSEGKRGTESERTEWHNVVCWDKTAETAGQYLAKGRLVYVEGRLQTRSYDGKDGTKKYTTEIVADRVLFLGGGSKGDGAKAEEHPGVAKAREMFGANSDDVPF